MKTYIRRSALKGRKMKGFRRRMKTRSGRKIINRQRKRATGKGKGRWRGSAQKVKLKRGRN